MFPLPHAGGNFIRCFRLRIVSDSGKILPVLDYLIKFQAEQNLVFDAHKY